MRLPTTGVTLLIALVLGTSGVCASTASAFPTGGELGCTVTFNGETKHYRHGSIVTIDGKKYQCYEGKWLERTDQGTSFQPHTSLISPTQLGQRATTLERPRRNHAAQRTRVRR